MLAAVSLALFCVQIDYFAMNLALPPRIVFDLNNTATNLNWAIALGAFMVPAGRIGDIVGRRRALLAGIVLSACLPRCVRWRRRRRSSSPSAPCRALERR
jgi:MFS family permease